MSVRKPEMSVSQGWAGVETANGTIYVPENWFDLELILEWGDLKSEDLSDASFSVIQEELGYYVDGGKRRIVGVSVIYGYGVRLPAIGLLKATDWEVFLTFDEAERAMAKLVLHPVGHEE